LRGSIHRYGSVNIGDLMSFLGQSNSYDFASNDDSFMAA